jgi:phage shock protein E
MKDKAICRSKKQKMKIEKNATIVDVRTPDEFAGEHFPGAINIPLDELAGRINELKEFPKPIVAYCRSGNRSGMALTMLKQSGITGVVNGGALEDLLLAVK